ncbi:MAG: ABC transporter ATP-binding protein [Halolamina sp.]
MSSERHTRTDGVRNRDGESDHASVLELDDVSKSFGTEQVIGGLDLRVREGEILTLLGPSGCGKTTTLRLVSGLERPDAGRIRLREETVAGDGDGGFVAPEQRGVGVVFQEYALFPHLTARENVAFGIDDWPAEERDRRVDELLDLVNLDAQGESYPDELSGGQQQRIALARSLAPEPEILLLDEPFSNLDVDLRVEMREEVRRILKETGVTAVSVTHDQEEAMSISDRVAVMNDGHIEQVGTPERVFQHPESRFVAGFLGHATFLTGYVHGDKVRTDLGTVPRDQIHGLTPEYDMTRIDVLVRPDDLSATPVTDGRAAGDGGAVPAGEVADRANGHDVPADPDRNADGRVVERRYLGPTILYAVDLDDGDRVECMHDHDEQVGVDTPVAVDLHADHELSWFPVAHPEGDAGTD